MPVPKVVEAECWPFGAVYAGGKPLPGQVLVLSLFSDCARCYSISVQIQLENNHVGLLAHRWHWGIRFGE